MIMRSPLNKEHRVTSPFGMRNLKGNLEMHNVIDLVPLDTVHPCELYAVCDGIVEDVCKKISDSHTGLYVTAHLHYEIRDPKGIAINPSPFIGTLKNFVDIPINNDNITQSAVNVEKDSNNINQALKVGDRVKVEPGAKDYNNAMLASFVYVKTYDVLQVTDDRIVIGIKGVGITTAINEKKLKKV